jgi:hypothetical protein
MEEDQVIIKRILHLMLQPHFEASVSLKCEDETHTPESGNLESSRTPVTSNTLP